MLRDSTQKKRALISRVCVELDHQRLGSVIFIKIKAMEKTSYISFFLREIVLELSKQNLQILSYRF